MGKVICKICGKIIRRVRGGIGDGYEVCEECKGVKHGQTRT